MGGADIPGDLVVLRAARGDHVISLKMRERTAERKLVKLESAGWIVEVISIEEAGRRVTLIP